MESSNGTYAYEYDSRQGPDAGDNLDAAIVNAFYVMNKVHDFTYQYGFNESAFNFQMSNFNRGGQENDGVIISVNDKAKYNNAAFSTPPE
jgi:extracellular elastinolytic metalloproteinase